MQGLQATHLLPEPYLLHSFLRDFSRSLIAHPIQSLPPELLEAIPLAASRKARETTPSRKARFPGDLPCERLGR
jgi:hypothetical protein